MIIVLNKYPYVRTRTYVQGREGQARGKRWICAVYGEVSFNPLISISSHIIPSDPASHHTSHWHPILCEVISLLFSPLTLYQVWY